MAIDNNGEVNEMFPLLWIYFYEEFLCIDLIQFLQYFSSILGVTTEMVSWALGVIRTNQIHVGSQGL